MALTLSDSGGGLSLEDEISDLKSQMANKANTSQITSLQNQINTLGSQSAKIITGGAVTTLPSACSLVILQISMTLNYIIDSQSVIVAKGTTVSIGWFDGTISTNVSLGNDGKSITLARRSSGNYGTVSISAYIGFK